MAQMQNYVCLFLALLVPLLLIQAPGNAFGQNHQDLVRITANFGPDNLGLENSYDMIRLSFGYTNNSRLCSSSCAFQFQGAELFSNMLYPNYYVFTGVLRVGTPVSTGGTHYNVYDTRMDLEIVETTEQSGTAFHKVKGLVSFGEYEYEIYDGTLVVGHGVATLDINAQSSGPSGPFGPPIVESS